MSRKKSGTSSKPPALQASNVALGVIVGVMLIGVWMLVESQIRVLGEKLYFPEEPGRELVWEGRNVEQWLDYGAEQSMSIELLGIMQRMKYDDEGRAMLLRLALQTKDRGFSSWAIGQFCRERLTVEPADLDTLLHLARTCGNEQIRCLACRCLGAVDSDRPEILDALVEGLEAESGLGLMAVLWGLIQMGADAEPALPAIRRFAASARARDLGVAGFASYAIQELEAAAPPD